MMDLLDYFYRQVVFFSCKFYRNRQGITSVEYGLIAVAIAVFVVAVLVEDNSFIKALSGKFSDLTTTVSDAIVSKSS
ncbi:Flp family type IVb pilin [Aggregatibacter actinomycetemcomitans]|uniref:Flp2 n=2 Tax=Aggregatibacter actinomycetemcomitans TaxID=714 RepID=Q6SC52_AGGAC|nr:Flp family type IVb pilin [Aggregatibacter actinomycetemcomitans]AAS00699.1 Flp2 [Aggregatibacter actinomycetemcomitans]AMQ91253.1 fimbrial protein [Aggregatibacter actinomycetemcomitans]KOE55841.1 fimbrial protein [Aggregatibacter actinomycetemcomitans serotype b str. S23A]TYA27236.1 Flp family type IVb pilin [Aggregatibacter actinomycetemcomitans]TYA29281.1 Flp family type IVb pilin [Aggregatibacter actinomycetemcomitans]